MDGSTYLFCASISQFYRGVTIDYIVHMCDDNQWILNQTHYPREVEHAQRTRGHYIYDPLPVISDYVIIIFISESEPEE